MYDAERDAAVHAMCHILVVVYDADMINVIYNNDVMLMI